MPQFFNDLLDDNPVFERCESFGGGLDSFTRSTLLPQDSYQYGLNTSIPNGMEMRTRAGADLLGTARDEKIQGMLYFDTHAYEQLIVGSDSKLWWSTVSGTWTEMTGWTLDDADLAFSAAQGVETVLFTDGTQQLRTWNGTAWSAALGTANTDPPQGASILLWHAGRLWAAGTAGGSRTAAAAGRASSADSGGAWRVTSGPGWRVDGRSTRVAASGLRRVRQVERVSGWNAPLPGEVPRGQRTTRRLCANGHSRSSHCASQS